MTDARPPSSTAGDFGCPPAGLSRDRSFGDDADAEGDTEDDSEEWLKNQWLKNQYWSGAHLGT